MKCHLCSEGWSQGLVTLREKGPTQRRLLHGSDGNTDDFQEPLIVASTRDTPEMPQQCPMQHEVVVLSVLRMKENKRIY
jgi:hypothetical protein